MSVSFSTRRLVSSVIAAGAASLAVCASAAEPPSAFVGAQGFGAVATGGRGGDVYHVTNLHDRGAGSLRYGIDNAPSSGRTIVFDVGGWIDLDTKLGITRNKITIAGQTAPGGIGVRGDQFSIGGDDIIIRHMRFRPGKSAGRVDAAGANIDANRIIYDHVSVGFSYDESFSTRADNLTLQYSSVSFGLEDHSAGSLIENGAGKLSFHHNVYSQNDTRNPKARAELIDWRDNVVYNYHNGFIAGDSDSNDYFWRANFDGNTYIAEGGERPMITGGRDYYYGLWYGVNNWDGDGDSNPNDVAVVDRAKAMGGGREVVSSYTWVDDAYDAPEVWQNADAFAAYEWTLDHFGATPWDRDAVDELTAEQIRNRTGSRVSNEDQLGIENDGYPTLGGVAVPADSDGDGMADAWETLHGLNPNQSDNNGDFDNDGYTNLEEYLMDIAPFPALGVITSEGSSTRRYAEAQNWAHNWQPSALDHATIGSGTVVVDAVGQHAGMLDVGAAAGESATLTVTDGWLKVADRLNVGGEGDGAVEQSGGRVEVDGAVILGHGSGTGSYALTGGTLETPLLAGNGTIDLGGGTLGADVIAPGNSIGTLNFIGDLDLTGKTLLIEIAADGTADQINVDGTLTLGGALVVGMLGEDIRTTDTGTHRWVLGNASSFSGSFDTITPGFEIRTEGSQVVLTTVPEPASLCVLGGCMLAALGVRR